MVCLATRALKDSVRPRRPAGVVARPLNFTVRSRAVTQSDAEALSKSAPSQPWTVSEFQRRRHQTWRAIRLWVLVGAAGAAGFWFVMWVNPATTCTDGSLGSFRCSLSADNMSLWQLNLIFGSIVTLGVSVAAIARAVQRHYRCPNCEAVPLGSWSAFGRASFSTSWGVALNPSVCSKCGAKLH